MTSDTSPQNLEELKERTRQGARHEFLCFWGHTPAADGALGRECFSQWYPAAFDVDGVHFATAEHFMMWSKARLFEDELSAAKILDAKDPASAKSLGLDVKAFVDSVWIAHRFDIVVRASLAKFSQNRALGDYLLATNSKVLVEASPRDRIWGIGLGAANPDAKNPLTWRGLNLLGFALMAARTELAARAAVATSRRSHRA